jgi:inosine-uridine nucleoside N-ribohydrolase
MMGHEGEGLLEPGEVYAVSERDGPALILEETLRAPCEIAVIGTQSNIAAAVARDASLPTRVPRLTVMGGMFAAVELNSETLSPRVDHNLASDADASVAALNAGFTTLYVPCDVTFTTALTVEHLERLRRGDALCRALATLVDVWAPMLWKLSAGKMSREHVAVLHDPLALWAIVDDRFHDTVEARVTVAEHDGAVRTFIDPVAGTPARVMTAVDAPAFAEALVECLLNA